MTRINLFRAALAVAVAATLLPQGALAQLGRIPGDEVPAGWPPIEIGARIGYDNSQRNEVAGAMLRIPVHPSAHVEVLPSLDVTFLRGLREYQYNFEAVYLTAGRSGGLYGGGGIGFRNTIVPSDPDAGRRMLTTYSIVVGAKFGGDGRVNPVLEFRRVFASDLAVDPQQVTLGATVELW
jgi:hypothetical protein